MAKRGLAVQVASRASYAMVAGSHHIDIATMTIPDKGWDP